MKPFIKHWKVLVPVVLASVATAAIVPAVVINTNNANTKLKDPTGDTFTVSYSTGTTGAQLIGPTRVQVKTNMRFYMLPRPEVKKEGYTLKGWSLSASSTDVIPNNYVFTQACTLYCVLEEAHGSDQTIKALVDGSYVELDQASLSNIASPILKKDGTTLAARDAFNYPIKLGDQVTRLDPFFLAGCTSFNSAIEIAQTSQLTYIGHGFLANCTSFNQQLDFSNCAFLSCIDDGFMYRCSAFNNGDTTGTAGTHPFTLPNSVVLIEDKFMSECSGFNQAFTIPTGLTKIGENFLEKCTSFSRKLVIPDTVMRIRGGFLYCCDNVTSIEINAKATKFDRSDYTFTTSNPDAPLFTTGLNITSTEKEIFQRNFPYLNNPEATPPQYRNLQSNEIIHDGIVYNIVTGTYVTAIGVQSGQAKTTIDLPSSFEEGGTTYNVAAIADNAFANNTDITSVKLPSSITAAGSIGAGAFAGCTSLTSLDLTSYDDMTALPVFGSGTFAGITPTNIEILVNHLSDKTNVRTNITDLATSTVLFGKDESTLVVADSVITGFKTAATRENIELEFDNGFDLTTKEYVGDATYLNATSIANDAFKGKFAYGDENVKITSIKLPNFTTVGTNVFADNTDITSVVLANTITTIYEGEFSGCSKLATINVPTALATINKNAFYQDAALTTFDLSQVTSNVTIGDYAFAASGLTAVDLTHISTIGEGSFYQSKLTSLVVPNTLDNVGAYAFARIDTLTSVDFSAWGTVPPTAWGSDSLFQFDSSVGTLYVASGQTTESMQAWQQWAYMTAGLPMGWTIAEKQ